MRTVDDIGNVVDHTSVEPGARGRVAGVGQVLGEHAIYDSDTGTAHGHFMTTDAHADLMRAYAATSTRCRRKRTRSAPRAWANRNVALGRTMNAILDAVRPAGITDPNAGDADRLWRALLEARSKISIIDAIPAKAEGRYKPRRIMGAMIANETPPRAAVCGSDGKLQTPRQSARGVAVAGMHRCCGGDGYCRSLALLAGIWGAVT